MGAAHPSPTRANARKVVAHTTAPAHGFRRFRERGVNAGMPVFHVRDGISHGLHKAVNQRGSQVGTRCRLDAPGGQKTGLQGVQKFDFPLLLMLGCLGLGQCPGHPLVDIQNNFFGVFAVLL